MTVQKAADLEPGHLPSINEPPGSDVRPIDPEMPPDPDEAQAPVLSALSPDHCAIGDADFTLYVSGTGLTAESVITFAGMDEPTTFNDLDSSVSTLVKPSLWLAADTVDCSVHNSGMVSNSLPFEFTEG